MCAKKITAFVFFPVFIVLSTPVFSQVRSLPKYELGLNVGAYLYQGDLTPHRFGSTETIKYGIGISGSRIISRSFSARLLFNIASLEGADSVYTSPEYRKQRNFSFTTPVKELALLFQWNILSSNYNERRFEPYLFAGAGLSFLKIKRDYSRLNRAYFGEVSNIYTGLTVDTATALPRTIAVIPVGAGLRYNVSPRLAVNAEASYRLMNNDYLDGFSQSASPKYKDHFSSISIGIAYKFGKNENYGCPTSVN